MGAEHMSCCDRVPGRHSSSRAFQTWASNYALRTHNRERAATNPILPNKPRSVRRLNDREAANEMLRICNDRLKEFCRH
jgi:hypothetical protein